MGKMRTKSLRRSMTAAFLATICGIALLSAVTIFGASRLQQEILERRQLTVSSSGFQIETGYVLDIDSSSIVWQPLSGRDRIAYYALYAVMVGLPVLYLILGIGAAAAVYYRRKLRTPIAQLQNGVEKIQEDDLDFHMDYEGSDELGRLCCSMEKMRRELQQKHKALWEALEQRKLLNASVAHDLRTPITVLKGYLDYLEKNAAQDRLTKEMLLDTVSSMQEAAARLEQYVECVRDIERIERIEIRRRPENVKLLLNEIRSDVQQLENGIRSNARQAESEIRSSVQQAEDEIRGSAQQLENEIKSNARQAEGEIRSSVQQAEDEIRGSAQQLENGIRSSARQTAGIEVLISDNIPAEEIRIDKSAFFRVLENLLQNAFRYARKRVSIDISQKEDFLILIMEDDGKGFAEADPEKAAAVFYSTDKGRQHFGIGLSVCKLLCEKHGGRLYLANGKDGGARVTVSLKII